MRKWPAQVSTVATNVGRKLSLLKMAINMANADYPSFFLWNELEPRCQQRAAGSLELSEYKLKSLPKPGFAAIALSWVQLCYNGLNSLGSVMLQWPQFPTQIDPMNGFYIRFTWNHRLMNMDAEMNIHDHVDKYTISNRYLRFNTIDQFLLSSVHVINSLPPRICCWNIKNVISQYILVTDIINFSHKMPAVKCNDTLQTISQHWFR